MQARHRMRHALLTFAACVGFSTMGLAEEEKEVIEQGKTVAFEYRLSLEDGTVVESNIGSGQPFEYVQGGGQILPALEAALDGLAEDDTKAVELSAEDAYGPVNPEAFQEIPRDRIAEEGLVVGAELSAPGYDGPIRVHEIRDETVVLDFNHPLAGKNLTFEIHVLSVD